MAAGERPLPKPTAETQPFWEGTSRHELWIQRCTACKRHYFYPRPYCPNCLSGDTEWVKASGRGELYSFNVVFRAPPGFQAPYVIAIVELEEGPRMMANLVGVDPDPKNMRCDMPVE